MANVKIILMQNKLTAEPISPNIPTKQNANNHFICCLGFVTKGRFVFKIVKMVRLKRKIGTDLINHLLI